jgi:hypothetical protein
MSATTGREENDNNGVELTASAGSDSAEAKRLAARRRFLLGGAAAVPVIVTLGQKDAWAASAAVCQSMGLNAGDGFTAEDYSKAARKELATSLYCRPY